jgi:hypothetical protein
VNEEALAHWGAVAPPPQKNVRIRGYFSKPAKKVVEALVDTD